MYAAAHIVSARRAFCLLAKNLAEVVNIENGGYVSYDLMSWIEFSELKIELNERGEHDDWMQAVNFVVQVPRVIRLIRYDRFPRESVKFSRRNVFLRDEHCCQYCGRSFSVQHLSLDHVIPRSRGGDMSWENIVSACLKCNVRKGGRTPQEAGMALQRHPRKPARNPLLAHKLNFQKYESWRNFCG